MKAAEIEIDGVYMALVDGNLEPVRVGRSGKTWHTARRTYYLCTVLSTGAEIRVMSVTKFRRDATAEEIESCQCLT